MHFEPSLSDGSRWKVIQRLTAPARDHLDYLEIGFRRCAMEHVHVLRVAWWCCLPSPISPNVASEECASFVCPVANVPRPFVTILITFQWRGVGFYNGRQWLPEPHAGDPLPDDKLRLWRFRLMSIRPIVFGMHHPAPPLFHRWDRQMIVTASTRDHPRGAARTR